MSEQGLKLVVSADVSQATKAMTDVGKAAREAGAVMTETGKAFQSSTGKIVQAGLSWNQFVGALKGPTKAAFKEATGQMLSCGEATREVAKEWALYKAAGLQVANTNNDITSTFQKLAVAQSQAAQTTPPTVSLNINEQLEAAMGRISASIDKAADEALRMGTALDAATDKADGNVNNLSASVNKLTENVKRVGGSAASFAQLKQSATANISILEAQLKRLETLASMPNLSTRQYDRLNQMAAKTRAEIERLSTSFKKYGGGTADATQATINLSRVIQDAPYGFMGIANNINPLLESFQQLRKQSGSLGGTFKALGSSLMGAGGIGLAVGVISSLLVVFGDRLFGAGKAAKSNAEKMKEAQDALQDYLGTLNDIRQSQVKGAQSAQEELVRMQTLYNATQNTNIAYKDRKKLVDELQSQYPAYFSNIKDETILAGGATDAYTRLSSAILAAAKARAAQDMLVDIQKQALVYEEKIADAAANEETVYNKITEARAKLNAMIKNTPMSEQAKESFSAKLLQVNNQINAAQEAYNKAIKESSKNVAERNKLLERAEKLTKNITDIVEDDPNALIKSTAKLTQPKAEGKKFNFFDHYFEVSPKTAEDKAKQASDMLKTALDYAVKNQEIFFGLDAIIKAPNPGETIERAKRWWNDYQNGLIKFKPPVINLEQELKMVPVVQEVDTTAIRNQFIEGLKQGDRKKVEAEDLNFIGLPSKEQILDTYKTLFAQVGEKLPKMIETTNAVTGMKVMVDVGAEVNTKNLEDGLKKGLDAVKKIKEDFKNSVNSAFKNFNADAFAGIGETIGQAAAGGADIMQTGFKSILGAIGSFIEQIGKALIEYGIVMTGLDTVLSGGIAIPGAVAIALGIAAVAAGNLVKSIKPPAFEKGGLVTGPVLGLVGEGRGTSRANPEVIAPLDKLQGMIGGPQAAPAYLPKFKLSGPDLLLWYERANKYKTRNT